MGPTPGYAAFFLESSEYLTALSHSLSTTLSSHATRQRQTRPPSRARGNRNTMHFPQLVAGLALTFLVSLSVALPHGRDNGCAPAQPGGYGGLTGVGFCDDLGNDEEVALTASGGSGG